MRVQTALTRVFGALWPLLFVPVVIVAIQSGHFGPYEHQAFEIGEPLAMATLVYGSIYCGCWFMRVEHAMCVVYSAILTLLGVMIWQMFVNANEDAAMLPYSSGTTAVASISTLARSSINATT